MKTQEQEQADRTIRQIEYLHRYRGLVWLGVMGFGLLSLYALIEGAVRLTHWLGGVL